MEAFLSNRMLPKINQQRQFVVQSFVITIFCRLDIGDGKDLDLKQCPRSKLQQQCMKYVGLVCIDCNAICSIIDKIVKDL